MQTKNNKKGQIARKNQIYDRIINLTGEFRKFSDSHPGNSLLELFNRSFMDYISFLTSEGGLGDVPEVTKDLWSYHEFSTFVARFNRLHNKCTDHLWNTTAVNDNSEILKDLYSDFKELEKSILLENFRILGEAFESYSKFDNEITLSNYKEKSGEWKNFDAWLNNFSRWMKEQKFESKVKEVSNV